METNNGGDFEYVLGLQKIETDSEDHLIIAGMATTETMDHDSEIVDMESVRSVWDSYMSNPVIKFYHGKDARNPDAIGKVIPEYTDKAGKTWKTEITDRGPFIVAKISNAPDTESIRKKIAEKMLSGLSIGGRAKRVKEYSHALGKDINRVITNRISEISVVDLPANPDSFFNVLKSACIGDQCSIKNDQKSSELITMEAPEGWAPDSTNDTEKMQSVEEDIEKLERENIELQKQIDELQSHTRPDNEEVVVKNTDKNPGGKHMEQDGEIVRFAPEELKDFIKGTITEVAKESVILEKADDYDRLLSETKDLRAKIEALEAQVTSQAKALQNQTQTTMKNEDAGETGDVGELESGDTGDIEKSELIAKLEARLKAVEESPLYKATQGDGDDMDEKDKKKTKKGHLANIVSESFGTGGKD